MAWGGCGSSGATRKGVKDARSAKVSKPTDEKGRSDASQGQTNALPQALRRSPVKVTYTALVRFGCSNANRTLETLLAITDELRAKGRLVVEYIGRRTLPDGGCQRKGQRVHRGFCAPKDEIEGAMTQVCAAKLAQDRKAWRRFLTCTLANKTSSIAWQRCAAAAQIDAKKLSACVKGEPGERLLAASMKRAKLGLQHGSPTLLVNGAHHRGGHDRLALLRAGCERDRSLAICAKLPSEVTALVLTDKRCKSCVLSLLRKNLRARFFPSLKLRVVDYSSAEGKTLYRRLKLKYLPAWLFETSVERSPGYAKVKRWMDRRGPYYHLGPLGRWNPTAEVCDNGKDDTGNGKVDCQDPTCKLNLSCRKTKPRRIDLFLMSQCPFANRALLALEKLLTKHKRFKRRLSLKLHYIADHPGKGKTCRRQKPAHRGFCSLHGTTEVQETLRQVCVQDLYGRGKRYLRYIFCRAKDFRSNNWRVCARREISAKRIARCVKRRGEKLLAESIKLPKMLRISGSPTWLSNNKREFSATTEKALLDNYCKDNPKEKVCRGRP